MKHISEEFLTDTMASVADAMSEQTKEAIGRDLTAFEKFTLKENLMPIIKETLEFAVPQMRRSILLDAAKMVEDGSGADDLRMFADLEG